MIDRAQQRIIALLDRPGMTKVLIASKAGVHRSTLRGVAAPGWNPTSKTLERLMGAVKRLERL